MRKLGTETFRSGGKKVAAYTGACIYCRRTGERFNRDHVIPESLGKFKNNFVLPCVCKDCNDYFGKELEIVLARDSQEGVFRLHHGVKPPTDAAKLRYERLQITVGATGPWKDARIALKASADGSSLDTEPVPQVGFAAAPGEPLTWILERQLTGPEVIDPYRSWKYIQLAGPNTEAVERVETKLREWGINYTQRGRLPQPERNEQGVLTKVSAASDMTIFRAVGKIAFNYLAYTQGAAFGLDTEFDDFRNWVRYGTLPSYNLLAAVTNAPILEDDSRFLRQTVAHIITLDWNEDGRSLLAQVSLFNRLTYKFLLCWQYSGPLPAIRGAHLFDIENNTISALRGVKKVG